MIVFGGAVERAAFGMIPSLGICISAGQILGYLRYLAPPGRG